MIRPRALTLLLAGLAGTAAGVGAYTIHYARGTSYLSDEPRACANCHVMNEFYDGWVKGSHRSVATCNDCHTPPGFVPKYATKAANGFWHSYAFTSGDFHEPIQIKPNNRLVTEHACRKCHADIVAAIEGPAIQVGTVECIRCHATVGHR
jgi:cytochrome c nitrite reductase small subunit